MIALLITSWHFCSCALLLDIPSVLADSTVFNPDDGTGGGGFVVHWLNNKDLSFTSSMDLFMLQLRKFSEQQLEQTSEDPLDMEGSPLKFDFGMSSNDQRKEIVRSEVALLQVQCNVALQSWTRCLTKPPRSTVRRWSQGSRAAPRHPPLGPAPACPCPPCCWRGRWRPWPQSGTKALICCSPFTPLTDPFSFGTWSTWMNSTRESSGRFRWAVIQNASLVSESWFGSESLTHCGSSVEINKVCLKYHLSIMLPSEFGSKMYWRCNKTNSVSVLKISYCLLSPSASLVAAF